MKILAENKKATQDYQILEKLEAGLVLEGHEVKAIRQGKISLAGSFIVPKGRELFLVGANVAPYQPANTPKGYVEDRARKLLLHKKEISYLIGKSREKGLTLLPLRVYTSGQRIKIEIAVAKGKKKRDRRQEIRKREAEKEIAIKMKQY